ncbi:uncharacterized protein [Maniola hyperantus]|uniref:uncharacterized protein n=1 Tax=Aphantopus hyperantus TaxID=2795564 RepID=UPI003749AAEC
MPWKQIQKTEAQLKKCWDNLKTRRKSVLAQEKRERMRTGGGSFNPLPSTSSSDPVLEAALDEQTDVELTDVIDSDNIPCSEELQIGHLIFPSTPQDLPVTFESRTQSLNESVAERDNIVNTPPRLPESHLTDYTAASSQDQEILELRQLKRSSTSDKKIMNDPKKEKKNFTSSESQRRSGW